jgi:hypothetical protein
MKILEITLRRRFIFRPMAAPSTLGLYGLAGTAFMVAVHMPQWFGGLAVLDGVTTAMLLTPIVCTAISPGNGVGPW